jgi:type III restriction enzyme
MKFKFDKNLDYQVEAVDSVVEVFDTGRNMMAGEPEFALKAQQPVMSNELEMESGQIARQIEIIQKRNNIDEKDRAKDPSDRDFTVEMETGTGKTYVYLRTALELNKKYGLTKFIVLVPSVAIREGVMKTIAQTKQHFVDIYGRGIDAFAYDSGKLSRVQDYAQGINVQLMVMTIQSFNKDANVMRQKRDNVRSFDRMIDAIAATNPVVIMDEPQNMESELSKSAISDLNPLFKLRYSATHKELHNLMYRLTPVDAYKRGLVKRIEVYGVEASDTESFMMKVKEITPQKGSSPRAKVLLEVQLASGNYEVKEVALKPGDDLLRKSKKNSKYDGLMVNDINARENRVELSSGKYYYLETDAGENKAAIFRTEIRETIRAHMDKQLRVGDRLKVLSLFFIDKVDNYVPNDSIIRTVFEEEYAKLAENYEQFAGKPASAVHKGYFAQKGSKNNRTAQDSTTGKSQADKEAYDLIMKNKEKLLSFDEPVSFIFTHSALNEGWDNPNVFQICTLNETRSSVKKRQEIGRGMRLARDVNGPQVLDADVNILAVIANESYREFVAGLQNEYDTAGYKEAPTVNNARKRVNVKFRKHLAADSEDFQNLWAKIRQKTSFNIELDTKTLVENASAKIAEMDVNNLIVRVEQVQVAFDDDEKIKTIYSNSSAGERIDRNVRIGNIIKRIERETGLTRQTIFQILTEAGNIDLLFDNPEDYTRSAVAIINGAKQELLINKGLHYYPTDDMWEVSDIFVNFPSYESKTIALDNSVYDKVAFDGEGEKEFAKSLDDSRYVKLFVKLPSRFIVDTPLGTYNPDWAIVYEKDGQDKLYLVRETKFDVTWQNLREEEKQKILCGEKHFASIGADYKVAFQENLHDLLK